MRIRSVQTPLAAVLLMLLAQTTHGQAARERETVRFTLYKWQVKKGHESYVIEHRGETTIVRSAMGFTDRDRTVPLSVVLTLGRDGAPLDFRAWGSTSRWTEVDIDVHREGGQLAIDVGGNKTTTATPPTFFVGAGYAPVAMTDQLFRYWTAHGRPTTLPVVPVGDVEIIHRGQDEVKDDDGRPVTLERYQVRGLEWGRETVWLDAAGHVAALKCVDAEFDHFEAVRNFTEALGALVASAASDGMAALEEASRPYRVAANEGTLALVGGTVVDATGSAPLHDAVVLVKGNRIMAVGARSAVVIPQDARLTSMCRRRDAIAAGPLGHARALRAGRVGADLPRGRCDVRSRLRQRDGLHRPGA